ncbi:MAG: NADP-dependent oxidoreductase [Gammaproteobacteria bacterium]|nr:NADP-dependent oxidoreductase [Gammaproteobacteria bacterium]
MAVNRAWRLARTPAEGWPTEGDFARAEASVPEPGPKQMLVRTIYLSLDPYQWGRRRSGMEVVGDVCHGRTVSQVVASNLAGYAPGDYVFNTNGWQDYGLVGEGVDVFGYMFPRRLDPSVAPISTAVGILGMLGLTAYAGVKVQCQPQPGETVVVSAASGGVGQAAGQIAKIHGCRVVGVAGTRQKCAFLTEELGFDAAVCHRSADYAMDLKRACPDGIDIYFENVGGHVYEGVLPLLNRRSRITLCGMISQYGNADGRDSGEVWREAGASVFRRQEVQVHPLAVRNFVADWQDRFLKEMADWMAGGLVKYREDIRPGLENAPAAFADMLSGGNFGKTLVQVSEDPTRV